MTTFLVSLTAVAVLLLTAVPGYLLIRKKMVGEDTIPALSKILLYVCQPCLAVYTLKSTPYSPEMLVRMGIFALLTLGVHIVIVGGAYLVLRKKSVEPIYRIMTIACGFGNCAFFGIPILEALLPDISSDLIIYTTVYSLIMNIVGWTVGSAIISRDARYISVKGIFLNPSMLGMAVAMVLFVTECPLPATLMSMVTTAGRMASVLSMLIMGMRLGTMDLRYALTNVRAYLTIFVKEMVMPAIALVCILFLPLELSIKQTFFIICACPVASVVLNYSEILGEGQKDAATMVLLGTACSIVTLPIMMLLFPLLH